MRDEPIVFVNQHYDPDVAATGQLLTDLCEHLAARGRAVAVLCSRAAYPGGRVRAPARERRKAVLVRRLWVPALGRRSHAGRLVDYFAFSAQLLGRLLLGRRTRVVLLTTPPLLPVLGALAGRLRGFRYGIWSMDLHPEAEIALNAISPGGVLARLLTRAANASYRSADFVVALGPRMAESIAGKGVAPGRLHVVPVWSDATQVVPVERAENPLAARLGLGNRFVVAYSGNAGLAHDFGPILEAVSRLKGDTDLQFLFIGAGPSRRRIERHAARHGVSNLRYLDYYPRELLSQSLSLADVHFVSLHTDFADISVPAKLYGIMAAARPVLFVGPAESEAATVVGDAACGEVVDPRTETDPAGRLVRVLREWRENRAALRAMGQRGREALIARFDRTIACRRWERVLAGAWPDHDPGTLRSDPPLRAEAAARGRKRS